MLTFGQARLVFAWLGDQSHITSLQLTINPELLEEDAHERFLFFRKTFTFFPFGFEGIMENVVDPAHAPFSHHHVMGNRMKVGPGDYIMELFDQDAEKGAFKTNYKSAMGNVIIDIDPFKTIYSLGINKKMGRPFVYTILWNVLISRDMSALFQASTITDPHPMVGIRIRLKARWMDHASANIILDGDSAFLQSQHVELTEQRLKTGKPCWRSRYLLSETVADEAVIAYRQWSDSVFDSIPYVSPPHNQAQRRMSIQEVNDRARFLI